MNYPLDNVREPVLPLATMAPRKRGAMSATEIKAIRERRGQTQEQFAADVGVERNTVARWEMGERGVSKPMALLIRRLEAERRKGGKR